jgi:uncharacterized repeat protein (TIGR01451 family)
MKFLNRILQASRKTKFVSVAAVATALMGAVAFAGWGPSRPVYDWNNPAERSGSMNGPVFNSFINTPVYGDERAFVDAKDSAITTAGGFNDQVPVEVGKEYLVRVYVHNNAHESTNASGLGVAKNTKVRVKLLPGMANGHGITGFISADNDVDKNGNPVTGELWDTVDLRNDQTPFAVEYVPGSAQIVNGNFPQGTPLSDEIVDGGVLIGDDAMNGDLNGCFEFQAYVNIKVRVVAPELTIKKTVRKAGETAWKEVVDAKPGETVQWLVEVKNTGSTVQNNVTAYDLLPPHVEYVPNTAKWYSANENGTAYDFDQFEISDGDGGYIFGNYAANGGSFLARFDTKVLGNFDPCSISIRNIAATYSTQNPDEQEDYADVRITREDCQPDEPIYRCDLLKAELVNGRKYKFTVNATAENGATIKQYRFNFGDNTPEAVVANNVVEHEFPEEGTFVITATVDFTVDGQVKSHTAEACRTTINTKKPPVTPPAELPKTGAGSVVGMFVSITTAAGLAHRFVWTRKFNV